MKCLFQAERDGTVSSGTEANTNGGSTWLLLQPAQHPDAVGSVLSEQGCTHIEGSLEKTRCWVSVMKSELGTKGGFCKASSVVRPLLCGRDVHNAPSCPHERADTCSLGARDGYYSVLWYRVPPPAAGSTELTVRCPSTLVGFPKAPRRHGGAAALSGEDDKGQRQPHPKAAAP